MSFPKVRLVKTTSNDELLTIKDVMKILAIGKNSVYLLWNSGMLPYLKLGDRKTRRKTLERLMIQWENMDDDIIALAREKLERTGLS